MTDYSERVPEGQLSYDWNGHTNMRQINGDLSDFEVAARVRMLMRDQLNHESVCCMARDRIMALSKEVARLRALLPESAS